MKLIRFKHEGETYSGSYEDGRVISDGKAYNAAEITWLPPVVPHKIIGLALNYADHAAELNKVDLSDELAATAKKQPALFFKPITSLIGQGGAVVYPTGAQYMHYEGELAVVLGPGGRKIKAADAMAHVKGYTIANDVTVRDFVQNFYRPPVKAKGFDTFGPLGPWLVTADELPDPTNLTLRTFVNGELRQEGNTRDLIYTIPMLIEYISDFMTLEPNDVILTGTPKGISAVHPGDVVRVEIDGIGALENQIVAEE